MDRASSFAKTTRVLTAGGFDVLAYDRPGYASAVGDEPCTDVASAADDLLRRIDGRPAVAVGHSYGGHVAMLAAIRRPDLIGAVGVFETPYSWEPFWPDDTSGGTAVAVADREGTEAAAEAFMRTLVGDRVWERLPSSTKELRRAEGRALVADLRSIQHAAPYDPRDLPVPLVVGRGSKALPHQAAGTDWILEQVPDAELVVIDGAGHGAHRSHPDDFARFVERVAARAGEAGQTRA
jgi:pimeloyl-ACP methyl ester carboxylesterase